MSDNIKIYQFKVRLKDINPMIWRRFLIQSSQTLKDLHYVIQILMGWTNYHLNEFIIHGRRYTIPNMIGNSSSCGGDGLDIKLEKFGFRKNEKFLYMYDFTAGWNFEVRLEKTNFPQDKKLHPICMAGSGASPDEECGGPYRFAELKDYWSIKADDILIEFLKALADEKNSDKRMSEAFDMGELREANYWLNIHKYELKEINRFLTLYAKGDDRWQEAFAEVIYL
jgi:pRiA4b ORF-3-like protein